MAPKLKPVLPYLKNKYYKLLKDSGANEECVICLTDVLGCVNCLCILSCGHMFHFQCLTDLTACPLCRQGN